ncbi:MAG: substrate-binding domain-containing protein [Acidimicrobiia bacterium]
MDRLRDKYLAGLLLLGLIIAACGGGGAATTAAGGGAATTAGGGSATTAGGGAVACDTDAALADLEGGVLSTGPNGESPVAASTLELSAEELAEVKGMGATAALVFHYAGNDWSQAQLDGLNARFGELGIEVIATTDANFEVVKQVENIETVLTQSPDIIVSIPTDAVATADAYKKAADAGVEIVFMDNVAAGLTQGTDYVSVVSADNYGNGVASAHLMAKALGCQGSVGIVFHAADFFVTKQRFEAFKATIAESYPGIEIAAEQGIGGPDFTGDAEKAASAMLTANPNLDGIWAVWDVPAEGVMAAARTAGRDDLIITTIDLGENVAIAIGSGELVYGLGAQRPYDQGVAEANLAAYGLLDKEAPPYVALNALPVTQDNLLEAWVAVYHSEAPDNVKNALG